MKSLVLKITPLLFGLFVVGVSFGSSPDTAQAYWSCAGGYESQAYSCVTDSIYWPGGYYGGGWCGYGAGWYGAGTYYCYGTCYQSVWNPNINCTWIPDCTTAYGSASCATYAGQYGIPYNYTVGTAYYSYNTCTYAVTYLGYSCSAPPAPTASLSQSTPSTVSGTQYTVSWSSTNATSCTVSYTGPDGGGTISSGSTSGGPLTLSSTVAGTYVATNICTGAGGTAYSPSITHTVTALSGCAYGTDAGGNSLTLASGAYTTIGSGQKYRVNKFGGNYCFGNSGGTTYFVPLNSLAEFNSFWNAISRLSGISVIP